MKGKIFLLAFLVLGSKIKAWEELNINQEKLSYFVKEKNQEYVLFIETNQVKMNDLTLYKVNRKAVINQKNAWDIWLLEKPSMKLIELKGEINNTLYHVLRKNNEIIITKGNLSEKINIPQEDEIYFPDTLLFVLRAFPFNKQENKTIKVYLGDNRFIKVIICPQGKESIKTQAGTFNCYKLILKPQGILGLFLKFSFWIYEKPPFYLIKYQGYKNIWTKQIIELKEILK